MILEATSEEYDRLQRADQAAFTARAEWIGRAKAGIRRGKQLLPDGDWTILLWRAGRGFGKSAAESEAMWWEMWEFPSMVGHVLAPTHADVRGTMFEGDAGLCSVIPAECLLGESLTVAYNKSMHEIRLKNGSLIRGFATTENGERLRGPQCHFLTGDELAAWDRPAGNLETAFNNAMFGVRLPYPNGRPARAVFGTTPRPVPFLKRLEKRADVKVVTGSSYENMHNLSISYRNQLLSLQGTLIGRQEIDGDYIDEESDLTIFKRAWFNLWPKDMKLPEFIYIMESWDTASSEESYDAKRQSTDPSGCLTLGVFNLAAYFTEKERRALGVRAKYGILVLDWWTERLGFPDLLERARKQRRLKWGSPHPGRRPDVALIEDKNSGTQLRQMMAQWGAPVWPYNPGKDSKTTRAHIASPYVVQKIVFLPESKLPERSGLPRDWCEEFLEQVCGFAGEGSVEHDEAVDCFSQAIAFLANRGLIESGPHEKFLDPEEERVFKEKQAEKIYSKEKSRKMGNPYNA